VKEDLPIIPQMPNTSAVVIGVTGERLRRIRTASTGPKQSTDRGIDGPSGVRLPVEVGVTGRIDTAGTAVVATDRITGRGCSRQMPQKGHEIETNRDRHQLRQVAAPLLREWGSDKRFEILQVM
jgi:hypothetical protein